MVWYLYTSLWFHLTNHLYRQSTHTFHDCRKHKFLKLITIDVKRITLPTPHHTQLILMVPVQVTRYGVIQIRYEIPHFFHDIQQFSGLFTTQLYSFFSGARFVCVFRFPVCPLQDIVYSLSALHLPLNVSVLFHVSCNVF